MGITKMTYGQKIYAKNATCQCVPCTAQDKNTGYCQTEESYAVPEDAVQLYCVDGTQCAMPNGYTNYSLYRCPGTCADAGACELCEDKPAPPAGTSNIYCRVEGSYGDIFQAEKNYSQLSDLYWDVLSALPNKDKCCLNVTDARTSTQIEYTYSALTGVKQRTEFLQFPKRGEIGLDCGRTPDTSFLTYCNVRVPIVNNHLYCAKTG